MAKSSEYSNTASSSSTYKTTQRTHKTSARTARTTSRSTKTTHTLSPPQTSSFPAQSRSVPASAKVPLSKAASSLPPPSSFPTYSTPAVPASSSVPRPESSIAQGSSRPLASTIPSSRVPAHSHTPVSGALPPNHHSSNGLSSGDIAAAVVVPILAVAALGALLFCFLRRRRRRRPSSRPSSSDTLTPAARQMSAIVPKTVDFKMVEAAVMTDKPAATPVVTASHNNAYLTGIDSDASSPTSARGYDDNMGQSRGGGVEPPPPYQGRARSSTTATSTTLKDSSSSAHTSTDYNSSLPDTDASWAPGTVSATQPWSYDIQPLAMPDLGSHFDPLSPADGAEGSNFRSPVSPLEQDDNEMRATLWAPPNAPGLQSQTQLSRTQSARSITSTLYSDSASVHSAHQAAPVRCSVIASPSSHERSDSGASRRSHAHSNSGSDPFTDPPSPAKSG